MDRVFRLDIMCRGGGDTTTSDDYDRLLHSHQIASLFVRARPARIFSSWLISTRKLITSRKGLLSVCHSYIGGGRTRGPADFA